MKNISQRLIVISFILSLLAALLVYQYLQSLKPQKSSAKKTTILVAAETIPPRTLIDKKMVKQVEVADGSFFEGYITDTSVVIGKYTKETIFQNEGFLEEKLLEESDGELVSKIDSNHRAISINVSIDSGVSQLIKSGDFVDVIVYLSEKKENEKIVREESSKVILQNIEVLAIDKNLYRDNQKSQDPKTSEKLPTNFLVTLSVLTNDAEKLVLAESIGSIKLTLRPLNNNTTDETKGITGKQLLSNSTVDTIDTTSQGSNQSNANKKYISYTIKKGDTLKKISEAFYGTKEKYALLKEFNNIRDENLIVTGTVIKIPIQD